MKKITTDHQILNSDNTFYSRSSTGFKAIRFTNTGGYTTDAILPIEIKHFYWSSAAKSLTGATLFNGIVNEDNPDPGLIKNPEAQHIGTIMLPKEWDTIVHQVKIYSGLGYTNPNPDPNAPTKVYVVRRDTGEEVFIGDWTGTPRNAFQTFTVPITFVADRILLKAGNFFGSEIGVGRAWGSEIQVVADFLNVPAPTYSRVRSKLQSIFGTNDYWWGTMQNSEAPYIVNVEYTPSTDRFVQMGIDSVRTYLFWDNIEPERQLWAVEPTAIAFQNGGGWRQDSYCSVLKGRNIQAHLCIMQNPPYKYNTWPGGINDKVNRPLVDYVDKDHREIPASYYDPSRLAYWLGRRYGDNSSPTPSDTFGTGYTHPDPFVADPKTNDATIVGMNTVASIEIGNEEDADYGDEYAYNSCNKQAAKLSAMYDGHLGTITYNGHAMGLMNACSSIKLVASGFSLDDHKAVQQLHGMIAWSIKYRGYNVDGSVNMPCHAINWHQYSSNKSQVFDSPENEGVLHSCAMPPELSDILVTGQALADLINRYCPQLELWLTEWGFENHPLSALGTRAYSSYTRDDVVAIWALRSLLLYPSCGVNRTHWFKTVAGDMTNPLHFSSMRLVEFDEVDKAKYAPMRPRTLTADYFAQLNTYKDYRFVSLTNVGNVRIVKYTRDSDSKSIWSIWAVETATLSVDDKFIVGQGVRPAPVYEFAENSGTINLQLGLNQTVLLRTFRRGATDLTKTTVTSNAGTGILVVNYNSVPIIISEDTTEPTPNIIPNVDAGANQSLSFPASTATITGTVTDTDGTIESYLWTKEDGPQERSAYTQDHELALVQGTLFLKVDTGLTWVPTMPVTVNHDFDNTMFGAVNTYNGNKYITSSVSGISIPTSNPTVINLTITGLGLGYNAGDDVKLQYNSTNYIFATIITVNNADGTMQVSTTSFAGSGTYTSWTVTRMSTMASFVISSFYPFATASPSTSSVAIPTSHPTTLTFTVDAGKPFTFGMAVRCKVDDTHYVDGTVSSYSGTTLQITTTANVGTGTFSSWRIGRRYPAGEFWAAFANSQITSKNSLSTGLTGLIPGVYTYRLLAQDNNKAIGRDTVTVTVN